VWANKYILRSGPSLLGGYGKDSARSDPGTKGAGVCLAAKVLGANNRRIIFKHLIPNCIGQIIVVATLKIPEAIFVNLSSAS